VGSSNRSGHCLSSMTCGVQILRSWNLNDKCWMLWFMHRRANGGHAGALASSSALPAMCLAALQFLHAACGFVG